jgi:hypothetical protein
MAEARHAYNILGGNPEEKRQISCRRENNIKMHLGEVKMWQRGL